MKKCINFDQSIDIKFASDMLVYANYELIARNIIHRFAIQKSSIRFGNSAFFWNLSSVCAQPLTDTEVVILLLCV